MCWPSAAAPTRGALYKTIHDARRKLRAHLAANGLLAGEEVTRR